MNLQLELHSNLSGYLVQRPTGTFGRLKPKRRQWFVLDEENQKLLYFNRETDVTQNPPLGFITLKNWAIALVLEEENSFVIHSEGKQYILSADNNRDMMSWVYSLQTKRERYFNKFSLDKNNFFKLGTKSHQDEFFDLESLSGNFKAQENPKNKSLLFARRQIFWGKNVSSSIDKHDGLVNASLEDKTDCDKHMYIPREAVTSQAVLLGEMESTSDEGTSNTPPSASSSSGEEPKVQVLRHLNTPTTETTEQKDFDRIDSAFNSFDECPACPQTHRIKELEDELVNVKAELAKATNRANIYKNRLAEKVNCTNTESMKKEKDLCFSCNGLKSNSSEISEKQNRFLNDEVLRLARQFQEQEYKYQTQQFQFKELESKLEQLKRDYVYLMQSSFRIINCDGAEKSQLYHFGGQQHKKRVIALLNEARVLNNTLPLFDGTLECLCHVDSLGFQHCYTDESHILHYVCQQLHQFYCTQVRSYQLHQLKWKEYVRKQDLTFKPSKELKDLVRRGIPNPLRGRVWCSLFRNRIHDLVEKNHPHYYNRLCKEAPLSKTFLQNRRQISLDLLRTMPNNVRFSHQNSDGVRKMQEVLQAFCLHNPTLGYCQGMNFLVAVALLYMDAENAFWCLVAIVECYFPLGYFDSNLLGAQTDQEVLKDLMREKLPMLYQHFVALDIEICTITLSWFLPIFFDSVPIETVLRIWDCFLLEGPKLIFRVSLAILKLQEPAVLIRKDAVSALRELKNAAKVCFDADQLMKVAFEELEPFPSRKELSAKQAYYSKSIKERIFKQDGEREKKRMFERTFERKSEIDGLRIERTNPIPKSLSIECAAVYDQDKVLICYGPSTYSTVAKVNCKENLMYDLNLQLDTRITCIHALNAATVIFGSLDYHVIAYNAISREQEWRTQLNDSVLSLESNQDQDNIINVYAGLADGTIAVIQTNKSMETFYVSVGASPVNSLCLIEDKLWCAMGNRLVVFSLKTFDAEDSFNTSTNCMDYISLVVSGTSGVWIALRNSSVLQLWDSQSYRCRLLFDIQTNSFSKNQKDDESQNKSFSITAILQVSNTIVVGTVDGELIFYDITLPLSRSNSAVYQPVVCQQEEIPDLQDHIEELPIYRDRNDSGCYSSNHSFNVSRRQSTVYSTTSENTMEPNEISFESTSEACTERSDNSPFVLRSSSLLNFTLRRQSLRAPDSLSETCPLENNEPCKIFELDKIEHPSDTNCCQNSPSSNIFSDINLRQRQRQSRRSSDQQRRDAAEYSSAYSFGTNSISDSTTDKESFWRRKVKRRWSVPEYSFFSHSKFRTGISKSVDALLRYGSVETLCSIADSYEYDDFFSTYTDDDSSKPSFFLGRRGSCCLDETRMLLDSLRLFGRISVQTDKAPMSRNPRTLETPSIHCTLNEDDTPSASEGEDASVYQGLRPNSSWTSSRTNHSTNDGSCEDESVTPTDFTAAANSSFEQDYLNINDWNCTNHRNSDAASILSTSSTEQPYALELVLVEKNKISDQPIKCLLETSCQKELTIISCAGHYDDDEAVLKWTKEGNEKLWTNDPIIGVCPHTKTILPSGYTRSRLPRAASIDLASVLPLTKASSLTELTSSRNVRSSSVSNIAKKVLERSKGSFRKLL